MADDLMALDHRCEQLIADADVVAVLLGTNSTQPSLRSAIQPSARRRTSGV